MLLENLKLMVDAGTESLMTTCGLEVEEIQISQVSQGQITFPAMAGIEFRGGTLQGVRLGGDTMLCGHLAEQVDTLKGQSGIQKLAGTFLEQAVQAMEGRYPRGEVVDLEIGPRTVYTRGTRSFGIKLRTRIGQLFVLAEVPSRLEYEQAKQSEYATNMTDTYLPSGWRSRDVLQTQGDVDSFLVYLRKSEADLHVEMSLPEGGKEVRTGILLEQVKVGDKRAMRVNLNLAHGPASLLREGDSVVCFVGVIEKSMEMDLEFLGAQEYPVAGGAVLQTALFTLPDELRLVQRRRAFRIGLRNSVPVEVEAVEENSESPIWMAEPESFTGVAGRLVDLSFSGARVIGESHEFAGRFPENSLVRCRIYFPDQAQSVVVSGRIRRSDSKLVDRETYQDELGIEFRADPVAERGSLEIIRQIVLKEQRSALARRVQATEVT